MICFKSLRLSRIDMDRKNKNNNRLQLLSDNVKAYIFLIRNAPLSTKNFATVLKVFLLRDVVRSYNIISSFFVFGNFLSFTSISHVLLQIHAGIFCISILKHVSVFLTGFFPDFFRIFSRIFKILQLFQL